MNVDQLRAKVDKDPGRRQHVEQLKDQMRRELRLEELRTRHQVTQQQIADILGVSQARVSKLEHQGDARLSSLQAYIEALGGHLEITAVFEEERIPLQAG
ncbi:MAG: helix-turn-helix domain-containing protein [Nitriliruptor sp.]|uniref:helix-turn-helix domain-containing protein n=1 Tax=Nitriliruptor sp. TaxID=2448056 RepID=UPI0034A08D7A